MSGLAATAQLLAALTGQDTRFTRHRGDGWQILIARPELYLRATTLILARLKADADTLPTRIGIGIGRIDSQGTADLRDAGGPAFEYSGRALDGLTRDRTLTVLQGPQDPLANLGRGAADPASADAPGWSGAAILALLGCITDGWTAPQAEAVGLALQHDGETQGTIAAHLGITRQALNLRLTGAGYGPILSAIRLTETYFDTKNL